MPKVSVILPTYNRAHLIGRAIRSVLAQTEGDWELLVVDDVSTDDTRGVVEEFGDSRIRYVQRTVNGGPAAARNTGIAAARGEYLAFLDSDNEWLPTKIAKQLQVFADSPDASLAVVTCGMQVHDTKRTRVYLPSKRGDIFDEVLRRHGCLWDTNTLFVRREGMPPFLFDESMVPYEDFDFLLQIARSFRVDYVNEVLVQTYYDDGGPHVSDNVQEGRLKVLQKYAADLNRRPETLSHHHVRLALGYYYARNMQLARRHLLFAAEVYPQRLQHWAWLIAAGFGWRGLWFGLRAFRHSTTR